MPVMGQPPIFCLSALNTKQKAVGLLAAWFKFLLKDKEQTEVLLTSSKVCACLCVCVSVLVYVYVKVCVCYIKVHVCVCVSAHVCACV